ncbi:MAG: hypothetical protein P4L81_04465 [Candidatus Pacebacteria bacterium]|nr:hypothetical protein [Candidatus Paceibacterota bacterium]
MSWAQNVAPSFDGGMNLNVAASLARGAGYGFYYDFFYPFPAQTDGPFILPAALIFRWAGVSVFTSQFVSLVYVVAFFGAAIWLFVTLSAPLWLALLGAIFLSFTPGFSDVAMNGYGELIVLFWFLSGLVASSVSLSKKTPTFGLTCAGTMFAMALLTKVVAAICVAPVLFLIVAVPRFHSRRRDRIGALALGLAPPILAWETFRLISLGGIMPFNSWWKLQLSQIGSQSGAAQTQHGVMPLLSKANEHLHILSNIINLNYTLLIIYIIIPILLTFAIVFISNIAPHRKFIIFSMCSVSSLYFVWWIFVTPTSQAWMRRVFDGIVLQQALIFALAFLHASIIKDGFTLSPSRTVARAVSIICAVLAAALVASGSERLQRSSGSRFEQTAALVKLAEEVRSLPKDATIFGTGWWKAPVLALFSERKLMNIEHWESKALNDIQEKYLVTDEAAENIAKEEIRKTLDRMEYEKLYHSKAGTVYRIKDVRPYPSFATESESIDELASGFDLRITNYSHMRGFYNEASLDPPWARTESAILLRRQNENVLELEFWIPGTLTREYKQDAPLLHVRSVGCLDENVRSQLNGINRATLRLTCPARAEATPMQIEFSMDDHVPFPRQIDFDSRLLAFILISAKLETSGAQKAN